MKKIFTLLVSLGALSYAFAQPGFDKRNGNDRDDRYANANNDARRNDHGFDNRRSDGFYFFTPRERDMEIASINREFNHRIESVRNKFYLFPGEKRRAIRGMENQRKAEISRVFDKYNDRRNKGDEHWGGRGRDWRN